MTDGRTFENNGRVIQENLIDPGPIPGMRMTRPMERETRHAMDNVTVTPMRKGVDE